MTPDAWAEANQRHLVASLARLRRALEAHAAGHPSSAPEGDEEPWTLPAPPALSRLAEAFALSPFERDVVLLAAGVEMDAAFAALCRDASGRAAPTFALALAALAGAHWSALAPGAPLRYWRLVEVGAGETLATAPVRIDERVLHFLGGAGGLDERLHALAEPLDDDLPLPPSQRRAAARLAELWVRPAAVGPLPVLCGGPFAGTRAVAAAASAGVGMRPHAVRAADLPAGASEREQLARLWDREAVLGAAAL
ncbi:MAG TPA: hypothetical protein VHG91_20265, partial [Longimicrobium sp.]|nr:hypothetical protein [Longimicrobium sp.]